MRKVFRRLVEVPVALGAVAALVVVWWMQANRAEQERRPHAGIR
jgi:hypothetical protein